MRKRGIDASIVFVTKADPIRERLQANQVRFHEAGFGRGRNVIVNPRQLADAVREGSPDTAIVQGNGLLAAALQLGGFRGHVIAVEHGALLTQRQDRPLKRLAGETLRRTASRRLSAEVAVSDFMLAELREAPHCKRTLRIYNGVKLPPDAASRPHDASRLRIGAAGRLIEGKGYASLIEAAGRLRKSGLSQLELRIAGTGPAQAGLATMADAAGLQSSEVFVGQVDNMEAFWQSCDIGAACNTSFIESFGLAAAEASASGIPVVASRVGGLPEVIEDSVSGTIVAPGNVDELVQALSAYAGDPHLRDKHGLAGRTRTQTMFSIERNVADYLDLIRSLDNPRVASP
jgi:glycosyltransferase involved in cell wall biosynthesis